jgi:GTP pyrophosphokinase
MVGALVNNMIVPLTQELKTNDIVKINTSKKATPRREWINIVKTTQAKNKIKNYFNKIDKNESLKKGEEILKDELKRKKIPLTEFITEENISKILNTYKLKTIDDLYINIGSNKLLIGSIINLVIKKEISKEELVLDKIQNREIKQENVKSDIIVEGIDNIKINIASCCDPVPGDNIMGYITKGNGISVHRDNCPNIRNTEERLIDVQWNESTIKKYPVDLLITTNNNKNILLDIISKTTNNNISVSSVNTLKENTRYKLTILVENKSNLDKFISDLKSISNILNIERLIQ